MNPMLPNLYGDKMSSSHPPHTKICLLDDSATVKDKVTKAHERFSTTAPPTSNNVDNEKAEAANPKANGILATLRDVIIPISELQSEGIIPSSQPPTSASFDGESKRTGPGCPRFITDDAPQGSVFTVTITPSACCSPEGEEKQHFTSYAQIEAALADKSLDADILAHNIAEAIDRLLAPLREAYEENEDWQRADHEGYPEET